MTKLFRYLIFNRNFSRLAFVLVTVTTIVLTLIPGDSLSDAKIWDYDKLGHAVMFGIWATLLLQIRSNFSASSLPSSREYFTAGSWAILFGGGIELLQLVLPIMRSASWADFLADLVGVIIFSAIHYGVCKTLHK